MQRSLVAIAVLAGLVAFSSSFNNASLSPPATPAPAIQQADALPEIADPLPGFDPTRILLDIGGENTQPETMQGPGMQPPGWKPEPPLDLTGKMPEPDKVREAIVKAVEFLLDRQQENGAWDVELTGSLLSQTADQAVDAISATSLAGVALRYHVKVDPVRIEAALKRGVNFVIDRVYRGKLPLGVWYANWRYTLGLKFLHGEFKVTKDEELKNEIRAVARRMINAMLRLQLPQDSNKLLEKKRKARISSRHKNSGPAGLGVVMRPPTDLDYRGGAPIERIFEGSSAQASGLQVGDRIIEAEGLRIENALDYYLEESQWQGGQKVRLKIKRDRAEFVRDITLKPTWPGYLGIQLSPGIGEGPIVEKFLPFSACRDKLEIGDIISEVEGKKITRLEEFREHENGIVPGKKIKVKVLRGEKKRSTSVTLEAAGAPEGWFGFIVKEEDKGDDNGVVVDGIRPDLSAGRMGLKDDDRVTWIGDTPMLGYDHFFDFLGTVPAGKSFKVKWIRDGNAMEGDLIADAVPQPFNPGFGVGISNDRSFRAMANRVDKGSLAEKNGMKVGDIFVAVNGNRVNNFFEFRDAYYDLTAGEEVTWTVSRGGKDVDVKYILPRWEPTTGEEEGVEEGGWAYYPEMGEAPSFATAAALIVMLEVQKDIDIKGMRTTLKGPLKSAANLINNLREKDSANGGQETYIYRAGSREHRNNLGIDIRGCQGRNGICELALMRYGMRKTGDMKKIIAQFIRHRDQLDAVRRMEYYYNPRIGGSPHNLELWFNAAYYWQFSHYWTLVAARECGKGEFKDMNEICVKALMLTRNDDGTWLGHPSFGKLCGTCEALWTLGETEGPWKDGYTPKTQPGDVVDPKNPTTQDKKDKPKEDEEIE
ncbi:MAG: PDZ domain-containing protein [Planctomycetes bacterium]|nr:PDZ domain-containing protein [Planctomycetota bacterium]MCW8135887.1 PDZ domain-containing protein [Planctomycetota bacterium]